MAYLILDETTKQYLAEEYDAENIAMAAANRHARETGHDASVWVGDRDDAINTGYYAEADRRDWNDLDHDRLNDLIRDRVTSDAEYMDACRRAGEIFDGTQDEERLADAAVVAVRG